MQNVLFHFQNLATLCLIGFLSATQLPAQTVIGGTTPHPSAVLDVQSNNKGLLPPRLTTAERNLIMEPATGLLIFNTTLNCIEMNVGAPSLPIWVCLSTAAGVTAYGGPGCVGLGNIQGAMYPDVPVNGVAMTLYANVTWPGIWSMSATQNGVTFSGSGNFISTGCQPITLNASGTPTAPGTFTWTTGTQPAGSAEGIVSCTVSGASSTPVVVINTPLPQIMHTTTGATGIGTPTGLPPGVTAFWADNTVTISGTPTEAGTYNYNIPLTSGCGSLSATGKITVPDWESVNCGAYVAPGEWKTFSCHNLGADESANPFIPSWKLNGHYYQWGRSSVAANGPSGPSSGEANDGPVASWNTTEAPYGAWADAFKTANDPCPEGFRVPTQAQWQAAFNPSLNPIRSYPGTWSSTSINYDSGLLIGSGDFRLFLPTAGLRDYSVGGLGSLYVGCYWSSAARVSAHFGNGFASEYHFPNRNFGLSIRCISE